MAKRPGHFNTPECAPRAPVFQFPGYVFQEQVFFVQCSMKIVGSGAFRGILLRMDDSVRPVSLPQCLSEKELISFLDLIQVPVERLGAKILIVYAEVGPVSWTWNEALNQFCVRPLTGG